MKISCNQVIQFLSTYMYIFFKVGETGETYYSMFFNGVQTSITGSRNDQERLLRVSTTMYVGNLSFFTTEEQLYELFGKCGDVKRIIMGLDKFKRTPCGFCFVEYYTREDSENAQRYINGTRYCFFYLIFTIFFVKCISHKSIFL